MRKRAHPKVYWANAMFSAADREFNERCASILRQAGYELYLPQESAVNEDKSPTAEDIFRIDTAEILNSDILVACIDQETIDPGVACEIGIAFANGVPIIGLYTDIRQYRQGSSRMYKNPYVIGAIEDLGKIVTNMQDLLRTVPQYLSVKPKFHEEDIVWHFDKVAPHYSEFVKLLESWYDPPWNVEHVLNPWLQRIAPKSLIEFGCASGNLAASVLQRHPDLVYVGYDLSEEMIRLANSRHWPPSWTFTAAWRRVEEASAEHPFDVALASFVLHDHPRPHEAITRLAQTLRSGGFLFIIDLSTWDLPNLTNLLRKKLAKPAVLPDTRSNPLRLNTWARKSGLAVVECSLATPLVRFPNKKAIMQYLTIFGIHKGMDLPLGLNVISSSKVFQLVGEILDAVEYPFIDQRAFLICMLQKD